MNQPQFHPKARAEFFGSEFQSQSRKFSVIEKRRSHPEAGMPIAEDFRRVLVRRFPYSVVYRSKGDSIYIIAVAHQRRHPNYWNERA